MSERRELDDRVDDPDDEDVDEELPDDEVEYFVEVDPEESWVLTSVPKSEQLLQTSNSAPSTLMVFGDPVSAPHISH